MAKGKLNRPGSPASHQLKLVCTECNNGWMSGIQEAAKQNLLLLTKGHWPSLDVESITAIAAWATMVTFCFEFADLKTLTATPSDRKEFMSSRVPGKNWLVYIGLCDSINDPGSFWHRGGYLFNGEPPGGVPDKGNTQTTTLVLGRAFFHTLSAPVDFLPNPFEYGTTLGIRQFWPVPNEVPSQSLVFTPAGVARIASRFWVQFGVSPLPHGGMLLGDH